MVEENLAFQTPFGATEEHPALYRLLLGSLACLGFLTMTCGTAPADSAQISRLIVNGKVTQYGTVIDGTHFKGCNGFVVTIPAGARTEKIAAPCPEDDGDDFIPHSGHIPKESPAPTPAPKRKHA